MNEMSRIGPFALEEKLAGSLSVYRAVHVEQRRRVALKLFSAPFGTGKEAKLEFAREWDTLKRLKHPHIVRCYGGGLEEMDGYLAMELVDGQSLAELLRRREKLPWEMVVDYALQMCAALEYAHAKGLVHQDLNPDKVLVTPEGKIKIADFRSDRHANLAFQTTAARTPEKLRYAAPEQIRDEPATAKTDLYALGCLLFEMLTGRPPFAGQTVEELSEQHLHQPPPRAAEVQFDCPIWLDTLIKELLAKNPLKRPHTAAAVTLALKETKKRIAAGTGVTEHAAGGISSLRTGADRRLARRLLGQKDRKDINVASAPFYERAWFLAVCLLIVVGLLVWFLWPPSERELLQRAEALLATGEESDARRARDDYLKPLLRRFPDGELAQRAQIHLDNIEMDVHERRLRLKIRMGRELETEHERLLAEAWQYEQFGDRVTALEKYQSMVNLLSEEDEKGRPYLNLARRHVAELMGDSQESLDRAQFVEERLQHADQLHGEGQVLEAQKIWRSIESLYSGNRELLPLVQRAQARLAGETPQQEVRAEADQNGSDLPPVKPNGAP